MAKYIVKHGKGIADVGAVLEFDTVPPSMIGKVERLPDDVVLEVATPEPERKRGRPPKSEQE